MVEFEIDEGPPRPSTTAPADLVAPAPSPVADVPQRPATGRVPRPVANWAFADHIVTHNQDMLGIRMFFGFAGALAWFIYYWLVKFVSGFFIDDWSHLAGVAAIGVLGWRFWLLHTAWRGATAARRVAYGLPSSDVPVETAPPAPQHPALRWLLTAPRWTQRAWAAHAERIVLDVAAVNVGEAVVGRIGPGEDGVTLAEADAPIAVLDALELLGVTERIAGATPTRIRVRAQARNRLFPPVKKPGAAEASMFANLKR